MNNIERKARFTSDWLDMNYQRFVDEGIESPSGNVLRVSDALDYLSWDDRVELNEAFSLGPHSVHGAIETIAKAFLISCVINTLWHDHLAAEEELGGEIDWEKLECWSQK